MKNQEKECKTVDETKTLAEQLRNAARASGLSVYRIANGKIAEHWANMDFVSVLQQIGAMPSPG